jgi:hypothetical protein
MGVNRAYILAALDSKLPEHQIMDIINVGRRSAATPLDAALNGALPGEMPIESTIATMFRN